MPLLSGHARGRRRATTTPARPAAPPPSAVAHFHTSQDRKVAAAISDISDDAATSAAMPLRRRHAGAAMRCGCAAGSMPIAGHFERPRRRAGHAMPRIADADDIKRIFIPSNPAPLTIISPRLDKLFRLRHLTYTISRHIFASMAALLKLRRARARHFPQGLS